MYYMLICVMRHFKWSSSSSSSSSSSLLWTGKNQTINNSTSAFYSYYYNKQMSLTNKQTQTTQSTKQSTNRQRLQSDCKTCKSVQLKTKKKPEYKYICNMCKQQREAANAEDGRWRGAHPSICELAWGLLSSFFHFPPPLLLFCFHLFVSCVRSRTRTHFEFKWVCSLSLTLAI